MAIDSRDKRASAVAGSLVFRLLPPDPDGANSAADRLHVAGLYRGVAAAGLAAFVPRPIAAVSRRDRPIATVES